MIVLKSLLTVGLLAVITCMVGVGTIDNDKLQKILKRLFLSEAVIMCIIGIIGVWIM